MNAENQLFQRIQLWRDRFKKTNATSKLPKPLSGPGFKAHPFRSEDALVLIITTAQKDSIAPTRSLDELSSELPGFIAVGSGPVAFALGGRGTYAHDNITSNIPAFRINPDSTTIVENHTIKGPQSHTIQLAYLVGFGPTIVDGAMSPLLDMLVDHSFSIWAGDQSRLRAYDA